MHMVLRPPVSIAAMAFACICFAQSPEFSTSVDNLVKQDITLNKIPGMAVAVTDGNKVAFEKEYGFNMQINGTPVNGNTVFHIGGLSEALTAFAVMQLAD